MTRTLDVAIEPLTREAFAPFGDLVAPGEQDPVFTPAHLTSWAVPFEADSATHLLLIRYKYLEPELTMLERHFHVTQGFLPLGGQASIMVCAAPTDPGDPDALPAPEEVRAFLMAGDVGVVLHRGTWHALGRFPIEPPHIDIAFLTDIETQVELQREAAGETVPKRTEAVDMAARAGVRFRLIDKGGKLGLPAAFAEDR